MSCYVFFQYKNSTLIVACRSKLESYYLSKGFVVLGQASQDLNNVPSRIQKLIHAINMLYGDFIMIFSTLILILKIPWIIIILVDLFGKNPHLNTKITGMIPLDCCLNNIKLVLLSKFIIYSLLMNEEKTWTRKIMKRKKFGCLHHFWKEWIVSKHECIPLAEMST